MDSKLIFTAGIIMSFTAILHLIGGQTTLVNPLLESNLQMQEKVEWLGAWHCITIFLAAMGFVLIRNGMKIKQDQIMTIRSIYYLCILFSISFIASSVYLQKHAPQYILFIPIALIIYLGLNKLESDVA